MRSLVRFRPLNAGNACNAKYIAFFGSAGGDQRQCLGQHVNAPGGHGLAAGGRFVGDIHHVGLAMGVKMGQGLHGAVLKMVKNTLNW
jgi:hypothetical protein